jgi:hypothetical protein
VIPTQGLKNQDGDHVTEHDDQKEERSTLHFDEFILRLRRTKKTLGSLIAADAMPTLVRADGNDILRKFCGCRFILLGLG